MFSLDAIDLDDDPCRETVSKPLHSLDASRTPHPISNTLQAPLNTDVERPMFKAILFGLLSCALVLPVFGLVISQFLPPAFVALGEPGWKQQHNQLVSLHSVQWLTVLSWALMAGLGGFVSTRTHATRSLRPAIWVGVIILLVWGVPVGIFSLSQISWVHISCCLAIMPAVLAGGALARRKAESLT